MTTAIPPVGARQITMVKPQPTVERTQTGDVTFAGGGTSARQSNNSNKIGVLGWVAMAAAGCCAVPILLGVAAVGALWFAFRGKKAPAA